MGVSVNKPTNSRQTRGGAGGIEGGATTSAVQSVDRTGSKWPSLEKFTRLVGLVRLVGASERASGG